ncbi:RNA polymerase sigma factor [Evansella cellulosilytica]|uniref:RNA polymerase, sigma-24 subunit, ECF subfamily n=1 Tax=Evansella cellulosilytica (strain ATCC 21833 / DSM 2522 / FERM P-1141 / JCM 9156 / N-4) TaxID=649639 RepID=E6TRV7_EVAC2|nr:RNA polymerase sigma factor [Evansella cellulosilytica]ADU29480.1 RNA polymerase, sigma-24 subunit, ECF subfamily [Evansella cellulosilytica DSM 2522]
MPTDEELLDEIKRGSQAAMEVLVKKHYKYIFAYVYRKLGDYHLAYDMTQEVFIKMMKSIHRYKQEGDFKHWLLKIAVNHCRDYFRSRTYKQKGEESELVAPVRDEKGNVWDLLSKKLDSEKVKAAMEHLPDYQKEAIILKFYQDLKIREIASITNSKEATVKSRLKQGLNKLKIMLKGGNADARQQRR